MVTFIPIPKKANAKEYSHYCTIVLVSHFVFSHSVMSDSLQPHGLQHARLPCPLLSPGVCSNSCPLSWWCHPTMILYHPLPPMQVRLCSKSFKLCFSSMWTDKFQMYSLSLEKAEEPEIKLLIFVGSWTRQGSSRKIPTSASLTTLTPFSVCITTNWKIL